MPKDLEALRIVGAVAPALVPYAQYETADLVASLAGC
jgi:hypothetical protein